MGKRLIPLTISGVCRPTFNICSVLLTYVSILCKYYTAFIVAPVSHIVINLLCSFSNLLLVKFYFHVILETNYKFLLHFIYHSEYVHMCACVHM